MVVVWFAEGPPPLLTSALHAESKGGENPLQPVLQVGKGYGVGGGGGPKGHQHCAA